MEFMLGNSSFRGVNASFIITSVHMFRKKIELPECNKRLLQCICDDFWPINRYRYIHMTWWVLCVLADRLFDCRSVYRDCIFFLDKSRLLTYIADHLSHLSLHPSCHYPSPPSPLLPPSPFLCFPSPVHSVLPPKTSVLSTIGFMCIIWVFNIWNVALDAWKQKFERSV